MESLRRRASGRAITGRASGDAPRPTPDAALARGAASAPALQRAIGGARLTLRSGRGSTRIDVLEQRSPVRILFPRVELDDLFQAVFVTTSGGLTGGDALSLSVDLGPATSATVTTQAAEKIYRSLGPDCTVTIDLAVGPGALLEWLPQETILFDRARLVRRSRALLAPDARLLGLEMVLFGRAARGETLASGLLFDSWDIAVRGGSSWHDAVRLDGDIAKLRAQPFGFGRAAGSASLFYAGADSGKHLPLGREIAADCGAATAGATLVNGVLLLRLLDPDGARLRSAAGHAMCSLRSEIAGLPRRLPRVWMV